MAVVAGLGIVACGGKKATMDDASQPPPSTTQPSVIKSEPGPSTTADVALAQGPAAADAAAPAGEADTPTAPEGVADTVTAPEGEADVATAPEGETDAAAAPAGEADTGSAAGGRTTNEYGVEVPAAGVLSADLLSALAPVDQSERGILTRVGRCGTHPDADGCGFIGLLGVVGFKGDQVALVTTAEIGSCSDADRLEGRVASLTDLAAGAGKVLVDPDAAAEPTARQAWAWVAKIGRDGFAPAADLITATAEQPSGIRAHTPTVMLAAPLEGWFIDAVGAKGVASFRLVAPDNKASFELGRVPFVTAKCSKEDRDDGMCADFSAPSVLQVVMAPDRGRLVLTTALGDGTHCGTDRVSHNTWPLPAGVTLTP
jgi:hypothetical protein